jgi:hypothetical protein
MDEFSKHIIGRRGAGHPCPCCVEHDKRGRSRLARHRLKDKDHKDQKDLEEVSKIEEE